MGTAAARPYPLTRQMVERLGGFAAAGDVVGKDARTIRRWITSGLTLDAADRIASALGEHLDVTWPTATLDVVLVDDSPPPASAGPPVPLTLFEVADAPARPAPARPAARSRRRRPRRHVLVLPLDDYAAAGDGTV